MKLKNYSKQEITNFFNNIKTNQLIKLIESIQRDKGLLKVKDPEDTLSGIPYHLQAGTQHGQKSWGATWQKSLKNPHNFKDFRQNA